MGRGVRRLLKAKDGAVAVETALVSSLILVPLLLGLWDVAQIAMAQAQLDEALQDAITYVAATGSTSSSSITTAGQAAYGSAISVSSSQACYCVNTTTTTPTAPTSVSCTGTCSSGSMEQFMSITVSTTVTMPFPVPYLGSTIALSSSGNAQIGT
jgi:Flp pilus assembly protein TadG